ncbi:MAG: hypothetical protein ABR526_11540 [Chthoniobacterales bacterium]
MLTRTSAPVPWPRLIGVACGTFGGAITLAAAIRLSDIGSFRAQTLAEVVFSICGAAFLFLAFPLYTGREWARRALVVLTYCITVAIGISFSASVFQQYRLSQPHVHTVVAGVCAVISVLTPPAFLLAVLHHDDIRCSFQAQNASNQAMQRQLYT